jgi:hypothetical protein
LNTTQAGRGSPVVESVRVPSEFLVFAFYLIGLGIAASTSPSIDARLFWILATVAVVGYMLSRGIAKAATRSRAHDPREDIGD